MHFPSSEISVSLSGSERKMVDIFSLTSVTVPFFITKMDSAEAEGSERAAVFYAFFL